MNEIRMQQILEDKKAQATLRAMGVEMSPGERRSPSQILEEMSQRALKQTVETHQDRV